MPECDSGVRTGAGNRGGGTAMQVTTVAVGNEGCSSDQEPD